MKKIPDNDFDRLFREKTESFDYGFEEDAWLLMEQKLRRRDRYVAIRNTAAFLLLFLLIGSGYYLLHTDETDSPALVKKPAPGQLNETYNPNKNRKKNATDRSYQAHTPGNTAGSSDLLKVAGSGRKPGLAPSGNNNFRNETSIVLRPDESYASFVSPAYDDQLAGDLDFPQLVNPAPADVDPVLKPKRKPTYSLTLSAGPEFSAVEAIAGGKGTINTGLLFNAEFKKLTFSTGIKYGAKNYKAKAYDYQLVNASIANTITGIDAACNILEVPLQVSYTVLNSNNRKIDINSSLSSYFMMKEKYTFRYTPESGINDYLLEKNNANQHYLSVVGLSASYKFKPVNNIQFGIEPYVKLPLGGVGEGKVRLKSSGVSLNLTYDLSKKN